MNRLFGRGVAVFLSVGLVACQEPLIPRPTTPWQRFLACKEKLIKPASTKAHDELVGMLCTEKIKEEDDKAKAREGQ